MENKLPHIKMPKNLDPIPIDSMYCIVTKEDFQKHPWLNKFKKRIDNTGEQMYLNKEKTKVHIFSNYGDEHIFDIETGKLINYALGF